MSDMFYIGQKDYIPKLNQMAGDAQDLAAASAASAATASAKAAEAAGYAASASQYYSSIKQTGGRIHIGGADNGSSLLQAYGDAVVTGNVSLGGAPGAESLRADKATGTVNYSAFSGAVAGQTPTLFARGADNNVGINLQPKGRGNAGINWGQPPARLSVAAQNIVSTSVVTIASVNTSTDTITTSAPHNFASGDCVFYRTTQNGINAGGTSATDRWFFVNAPTSTTLTLHNTLNDALSGVSKLDITAAGTGVETLAGASLMISAANSQGNQNSIDMLSYRHTAGSDWTGIGTRMQVRTDNTSQGYLEFNPPGNNYGTKLGTGNSGMLQFATGGGIQMVVANVGATVNYARVRGGPAGTGVIYEAEGADAAIATNIGSKGPEHINFYTNSYIAGTGVRQVRITHTANANNYVELTGGANGNPVSIASQGVNDADVQINYVTKGGGAHLFRTGGGAQLAVTNVNNAVNYWNMRGSASGGGLIAEAVGSDAAVPIAFYAKGAGNIDFHTGGGAGGERQFLVSHTAGSAAYLNVTGNTTGNYPRLSGTGEANTGIDFSANGSGNFWFRSNGGTATQLCIQGSAAATANWAQVAGGAANIPPSLAARGEANVGLSLNANGTGSIFLTTGGNAFTSQARINHTASAVNYLTLTGGAAATGGVLSVDGTGSANLDLQLNAKGSGQVVVGSITNNTRKGIYTSGSGVAGGAANQAQVGYFAADGLQLIGNGSANDVVIFEKGGSQRITVNTAGVEIQSPLNVNGDISVNSNVVSTRYYFLAGSSGVGGGQFRSVDDSGTQRWVAGIGGSVGARDYYVYDLVNSRTTMTISATSGLATFYNGLTVAGNATTGMGAGQVVHQVNGGNSGNGGGASLVTYTSGVPRAGIGNWSGIFGTGSAYDATPTLYFNGGLAITDGGTMRGKVFTSGRWYIGGTPVDDGVSTLKVDGSLMTTGGVTITGGALAMTQSNAGVELGSTSSANTPFIDFHSSGSVLDYDARIIANGGSGTAGQGTLTLTAKATVITGELTSTELIRCRSKVVSAANGLTSWTVAHQRIYLTGSAGASLALAFPAGSAAIDGEMHTIMSATARSGVTWSSAGASFVGAPGTLAANTPVTLQYDHPSTAWYVTQ